MPGALQIYGKYGLEGKCLVLQGRKACRIRQPQRKAEQPRDSILPAKLSMSGVMTTEEAASLKLLE